MTVVGKVSNGICTLTDADNDSFLTYHPIVWLF
jgi:hypothetical protein